MRISLLALALLGSRIVPLSAQTIAAAPDTTTRDTTAIIQQGQPQQLVLPRGLFSRGDAYLAAGFAAATFSLFPVDRHFAEEMQSPAAQSNATLGKAAST